MRDPADAATAPLRADAKPKSNPFVRVAPGPELPDARDPKGAQGGMAIALLGGGLFWAAAIGATLYFLRR